MHARQIARGGLMTGVSVALLYIATFLSIASWAACMVVGFLPELFFLVGEKKTGCLVYAATAALSLFLLPDKVIAILYAGLFGLYTVLRFFFERIPSRIIRWLCKLVFGNIWVIIVLWCIRAGADSGVSGTFRISHCDCICRRQLNPDLLRSVPIPYFSCHAQAGTATAK